VLPYLTPIENDIVQGTLFLILKKLINILKIKKIKKIKSNILKNFTLNNIFKMIGVMKNSLKKIIYQTIK